MAAGGCAVAVATAAGAVIDCGMTGEAAGSAAVEPDSVVTHQSQLDNAAPTAQEPDTGDNLHAGRARFSVPVESFNRDTCRLDPTVKKQLETLSGKEFSMDAFASSANHAVCEKHCTGSSFLSQDCSGHHVWIDPPTGKEQDYLQHYLQCKGAAPASTSAVLLLPKTNRQLRPLLQGMTLLKTYSRGTRLYNATSGSTPQPGIPAAVQAWLDSPTTLAAGRIVNSASQESTVMLQSEDDSSMTFRGELSGTKARVHVDTGATPSFVAAHFVERAGLAVTPAARSVTLADGQIVKVNGMCRARLRIGEVTDVHQFLVLSLDAAYDVLLGQDWLKKKGAVLDFGSRRMAVASRGVGSRTVAADGHTSGGGEAPDGRISALRMKKLARKRDTETFLVLVKQVDIPDARCAALTSADNITDDCMIAKDKLQRILDRHKKVFAELPGGVIRRPELPDCELSIEFEAGKQPPVGYQYRLSQPEREELQKQLTLALEKGWVEPSSSPYGAPVLFARKKGGSLRWCIDYRALNTISRKNRYPLPRIDDLLDQLNGAACFSGLDLASGYWQIPVKEADKHKTAFRTPYGLYQWKVMPFGLTNAPAVFARTMQQVFSDMIGKFVLVYLDDILVYSKSPEEHEKHLAMVLERLEKHKFYAQLHKCHFALPEVEFLGHMVSKEGIKVDPRKVKIVQDWPQPKNVSELRSFLGLANYFRRFIHAYSTIAKPLHALTAKDSPWLWTGPCSRAFELLKEKLTAAPVLAAPDFGKPFEVVADASDFTLGAILSQEGQPIAYESRKLSPAECNYHTTDKELLAVIHALTVWRCYLDGSQFTIYSDHEPLRYLKTKSTLLPRQVRWSQFLERFDYTWEYRPGRINAADPLSRALHAAETGSGTGSLTGKDRASDTVLDSLAAITTRSQRDRVPARPYTPPQSPRKRREGKQSNRKSAAASDDKENEISQTEPVSEQVAAEMREALIAAYKEKGEKLAEEVARYSLRQTDDGLYCRQQHVYVPTPSLRRRCLQEIHDAPYSGHKGVNKTLAAVQRLYWWPGMKAAVTNYVTTCASCQRNKVQGKKPIGLLQPLEVPAAQWAEVTMDFITGLPCTAAGHDAIMVFCDRLTKMVHFAACTTTIDAAGAAKLFRDRVVAAHGLPVSIISDRDARFTSDFWKALVGLLGIQHKMSSAFHPQTDGQTERVNRVLEEYLRHYVNPSQDDWDEWLSMAEFSYNNSVHEATKETPFFLNYGMHPLLPGAVRTQAKPVPAAKEFAEMMKQIISNAKEKLEAARKRAARNANPARREAFFSVGDMVLLSSKNITMQTPGTNKLLPKYLGPFKVLEALSPVSYRLDLPPSMKCYNVFHASLLLEYKTDGRDQPPPPPLAFDDGEGGQWCEIDRVLSHRKTTLPGSGTTVTQYLVKWSGYGDEWNEWRDEVGVSEVATEEYWARLGGRSASPPHLRRKRKARGTRAGQKLRNKRLRAAVAAAADLPDVSDAGGASR